MTRLESHRTRTKLVDIVKVAVSVGIYIYIRSSLIGMHAYTGCDTVSAPAGKGKASALKRLTINRDIQDTLLQLGQMWNLSRELIDRLEAFKCRLYALKSSSTNVNDLRYDMFCAKIGEIQSYQLPPCRDCLVKHAQRANYQAAIWRRCLEQDPKVPSPVGRGWKIEEEEGVEQLVVHSLHWMDEQPVPQAVLDLLACNCTWKCSLHRCVCLPNELKCTDMCRLQDCENQASSFESDDEESAYGDIEELTNEYDF